MNKLIDKAIFMLVEYIIVEISNDGTQWPLDTMWKMMAIYSLILQFCLEFN